MVPARARTRPGLAGLLVPALLAALLPLPLRALNNGLGLVPQMGYSSWNDCGSHVTETHIKAMAEAVSSLGLAAKGYRYINVDEGWLLGRDEHTGIISEDLNLFPSGMKALGDFIHDFDVPGLGKVLKYGLYTCRGTCQCSAPEYRARCKPSPRSKPACEGSNGFEVQDARWMVAAGMDYLKEDSCCGSQDHETAFADYARMRDALNATGKVVFFSLCGWYPWYAPVGYGLANSWRISGDGHDWDALALAINRMAAISRWNGPGGWNDPDLLIADSEVVGGISNLQSRAQFTLWCVFPAPLLISFNLTNATAYQLETWGNEEAIAVNQDPAGRAGFRVLGGNLTGTSGANVWAKELSDGAWALAFVNNKATTQKLACDAACFADIGIPATTTLRVRDLWAHTDNGTVAAQDGILVPVPGDGGSVLLRLTPHFVVRNHTTMALPGWDMREHRANACSTDEDCSLLGVCQGGACKCDPGWTGTDCGQLKLKPLDITKGYQNSTRASWGGRIVQDPSDGSYHLFATEIARKCPLILFQYNSQVIRATSTSGILGPYEHREVVLPPFHHNPTIIGPTPDGYFLMFFIGANNASNMIDCRSSIPPKPLHPNVLSNEYITMAWSKSVHGPWQQRVILNDTAHAGSWHCVQNNPSAVVLPNGTTYLVFRANDCAAPGKPYGGEYLGFAHAPHWSANFTRDETPILAPGGTNGNNEDPFAWADARGNWHVVVHEQSKGNVCGSSDAGHSCGAHLFARSPYGPWRVSKTPAYTPQVELSNGTMAEFQTRQRPQIVFDAHQNPMLLLNGGSFEGNNPDLTMLTHTYLFEVDAAAAAKP